MEFRIWVDVYLAGRVLHRQLGAQVEREATGIETGSIPTVLIFWQGFLTEPPQKIQLA